MSALPPWVETVAGFDKDGEWLPIVCTDRDAHAAELLDVYFRPTGGGEMDWQVTSQRCRLTRIDPEWMHDEHGIVSGSRNRGRGSVEISCPACPRTPRVSRDDWWRFLDAARVSGARWADVSALV